MLSLRRSFGSLAAAWILVAGLGACSTSETGSPGSTSAGAVGLASSESADSAPNLHPVGQEWRYSFAWASPQAYYESSYQLWQLATAACMETAGFAYQPVEYVDSDAVFASLNPLNEEIATEYGYGEPPSLEPDDSSNTGDEAYFESLLSEDGCSNVALNYAFGASEALAFSDRFNELVVGADAATSGFETTVQGATLLSEWSQCMAEDGYSYRFPGQAALEFNADAEVTDEELRVRRSDLECDQSVGLTEARSRFEQEAVQQWAEDNAEAIDEVTAILQAAQLVVADRREALAAEGPSVLESIGPFEDPE